MFKMSIPGHNSCPQLKSTPIINRLIVRLSAVSKTLPQLIVISPRTLTDLLHVALPIFCNQQD